MPKITNELQESPELRVARKRIDCLADELNLSNLDVRELIERIKDEDPTADDMDIMNHAIVRLAIRAGRKEAVAEQLKVQRLSQMPFGLNS